MQTLHVRVIILLSCLFCFSASTQASLNAEAIVRNMETRYSNVQDYRTEVEVNSYKTKAGVGQVIGQSSVNMDQFVYTFKKPNLIRIDFISPHSGWILIYPDENGKAYVRSSGSKHFLKLHLSTDSRFLKKSPGQRVDQTDMGLLIKNISHSVTDKSKGVVNVVERKGVVEINVLAEDHFRADVVTFYRFMIDSNTWLPIGVDELSADGKLTRSVSFKNTVTNLGTSESFFRVE